MEPPDSADPDEPPIALPLPKRFVWLPEVLRGRISERDDLRSLGRLKLAAALGITLPTLSKALEGGTTNYSVLETVANKLDVQPGVLAEPADAECGLDPETIASVVEQQSKYTLVRFIKSWFPRYLALAQSNVHWFGFIHDPERRATREIFGRLQARRGRRCYALLEIEPHEWPFDGVLSYRLDFAPVQVDADFGRIVATTTETASQAIWESRRWTTRPLSQPTIQVLTWYDRLASHFCLRANVRAKIREVTTLDFDEGERLALQPGSEVIIFRATGSHEVPELPTPLAME